MNRQTTFSEKEYRLLACKLDKATEILNTAAQRYPDHHVAMYSQTISQIPEQEGVGCETVACIAGFYYLGKVTNPKFSRYEKNKENFLITVNGDAANFIEGAEMFARDLGFKEAEDICQWAEQNPTIWGNNNGLGLFSHEKAYGRPADMKLTIDQVVVHLREVSERLRNPSKRTVTFDKT